MTQICSYDGCWKGAHPDGHPLNGFCCCRCIPKSFSQFDFQQIGRGDAWYKSGKTHYKHCCNSQPTQGRAERPLLTSAKVDEMMAYWNSQTTAAASSSQQPASASNSSLKWEDASHARLSQKPPQQPVLGGQSVREELLTYNGIEYYYHSPPELRGVASSETPAVIMLHGGSRAKDECTILQTNKHSSPGVKYLLEHFTVYTPFLTESSDSYIENPKTTQMLESVRGFIKQVREWHHRPVVLTGYSFGGMCTWYFADMNPFDIACFVPVAGYTMDWLRTKVERSVVENQITVRVVHAETDAMSPPEPEFWNIMGNNLNGGLTLDLIPTTKEAGAHSKAYRKAYVADVTMWQWAVDVVRRAGRSP